jgi:predicted MPP superfamily phosphohydrolase
MIEPFWIEVTRIDVPLDGLDPRLDGFTILQLSDIHITPWMLDGYLDRVARRANSLHPDVIALTGDYVFKDVDGLMPALGDFFKQLQPAQAKLAILGNHDHWEDPALVRSTLAQSGIVDLSNTTMEFTRNGGRVLIAGLDDPWEKLDDLKRVGERIPEGEKAVLLVHEPDYAPKYAATGKFSLQLSGHSHGGQVRVPGMGAPMLPEYGHNFPEGLQQIRGMWVYTNRGIGAVPIRLRLNCRPEITLITLHPGKS